MLPLKLVMKNIGPFNGKAEIDFTKYSGVFLISGDTGAGKSTILDAISYALYSITATYAKKEIRFFRSDFVRSDETAYVEFMFSIMEGDKLNTYEIYRELPDENKAELVKLYSITGDQKKEFLAKKNDIDDKILSIIKLGFSEFSKIILLPQGQFAEFIKKKSTERADILKELFDVKRFEYFINRTKEKLDIKRQEVKNIEDNIADLQKTYDSLNYEESKNEISSTIETLKVKIEYNSKKLEQDKAKKIQAENFVEKQKALDLERTNFEKIKLEEKDILALEEKLATAQKLSPLIEKLKLLEDLELDEKALNEKLSAISSDYNKSENELKELTSPENLKLIAEKNEEYELLIKKEDRLRSALETFTALKQNKNVLNQVVKNLEAKEAECEDKAFEIAEYEKEIASFDKEILKLEERSEKSESLRKEQEQISKLLELFESVNEKKNMQNENSKNVKAQKELLQKTEGEILRNEELLQNLKHKKDTQENRSLAIKLARTLINGEACPVCGSIHHPSPASNEAKVDEELYKKISDCEKILDLAKVEKEKLLKSVSACEAKFESFEDEIKKLENSLKEINPESATLNIQELKAKQASLRSKVNLAVKDEQNSKQAITKKSQAEQKLKKQNISLELLRNEVSELKRKKSEISIRIHSAKEQVQKSLGMENFDENISPDLELEKIMSKKESLAKLIQKHNEQTQDAEKNSAKLSSQLSETKSNLASICKKLEKRTEELEEACESLSIKKENIKESSLDAQTIETYNEKIASFNKNKISTSQRIKTLEEELKNAPKINLHELKTEIEKLESELYEMRENIVIESQRLTVLKENHKRYVQLCKEHDEAVKESNTIKILYDKISGNNIKRKPFDIWRLSHLFTQVITFANGRFMKISNGRYFLELSSEGAKVAGKQRLGLDLRVYDSHTGKTRPVSTLSGGETFIASLCIALGLADTLSNNAGGIKINCMFIDEGFDTLDSGNLARVFDSLDFVTKSESLAILGVISHVTELESRIQQKLYVTKTNTGSIIKQ